MGTHTVVFYDNSDRLRRYPQACTQSSVSILNYLLPLWGRVLLEKLTDSQLVKEFAAFYGTRTFITAFTSARNSGRRQVFMFRDKASFCGEDLLKPRPNPKL